MLKAALQQSIRFVPWELRGWIKYIPGLAALQRVLLRNMVDGHEFEYEIDVGPAKGLRYPVLLPDDKGVWTGNYEIKFVSALVEAIAKENICFDIGGWRGYCGGAMATHKTKKVYIFEPFPENCARIKRLIALNKDLSIELIQSAVGDDDGTAAFATLPASSMGKLSDSPFQPNVGSSGFIMVELISLDKWRKENNIDGPQVVKIDVEGAELRVLTGARQTIADFKPVLFIECHSRVLTTQVCDFLKPLGYTFSVLETGIAPNGVDEPEVCHLVARVT